MTETLEQRVRARSWHYLNADVAAVAGMTLADLQSFIGGTYTPTESQLVALAKRMGVAP
jgi:hypothetical protein